MLYQLHKRELEEKLRTFKKILAEEKDPEGIADAQERIARIKAELEKLELPDEAFRA